MPPDHAELAALRRAVTALEGDGVRARGQFGLGLAEFDEALGGGLARGALHEAYARRTTDAAAATGFALALALRAAEGRPLIWARQDFADVEAGALDGAGISAFGLVPNRLTLVRARDPTGVLRAAAEAARCSALGAALVEIWGEPKALDLKAGRRLALAAGVSGVTVVMIRAAAEPAPSAANSRWRVSAAPSAPLEADAPGRPAFLVELLRRRTGFLRATEHTLRLEWDRDRACFAAPLPRAVVSVPADRPDRADEAGWRRAG